MLSRVEGMYFRLVVWGLGLRSKGLEFGVLGFEFWVSGFGFRVLDSRFWVLGSGYVLG